MRLIFYIIWIILAVIFAIAFALITEIFHPQEKINALWLVIAAGCFFSLAYRFYGAFLATKVLVLDEKRVTPAFRLNDGKNFYPTNKWVLFGHHFAAIAGAGPLIGPVLAAQFGYLPGFIWILIGAVFAGGVHDLVILFASIRRDGRSLAQIAREEVSPITGGAALLAILFILIVAMAGLGLVVINALFRNPWGTFIIGMTIPIAFLMGIYLKSLRPNKVLEVSLIGIILLIFTVIAGKDIPSSPLAFMFDFDKNFLTFLLAFYGFVASVLPVWMLLAPRDYLSSFMKIGVIILLALGILVVHPQLLMPPVTKFIRGGGPIIPGPVFPFVFITIACGAISGFHSLIASGTTPKMIEKETYARAIGYGAMLTEGFVAVIALIAASVLIPGDYFAINSKLSFSELANLGFPVAKIKELSTMIGVNLEGRPGGAVSLAVGMAFIFSSIPFLKKLMAYWYQFALMFEALFILTTIDAGTRVARYLVQELGGYIYKPFGNLSSFAGNIVASFIVVFSWGYLIFTGSISTIWPLFGTANQLLGMLALCIGTTIIIKSGKVRYIWTTLLPLIFVGVATFTAAFALLRKHLAIKATSFFDWLGLLQLDAFLVIIMVFLALVILIDSVIKWIRFFSESHLLSGST